ncbi:hypothetical protein D0726_003405 [Escherichia coli]|nr:hypothetical protein [Escherichia coli]
MAALVNNPFNRKASDYVRDINVIDGAINQFAIMISRSYKIDYKEARDYVVDELKNGTKRFRDPIMRYLQQDEFEDRHPEEMKFSQYIRSAERDKLLMAPTFTQIIPPDRKESMLSSYIKVNLAKRNAEKKAQLQAANHGDKFKESLHKNNQNNKKILNNAISGNHRSIHSILYDRPVHPILTSCCRIANGSANSNNDRLLMGSRHYYTPDTVLANIASILELSDWPLVRRAVDKHNLHKPTVEETLAVIKRSTDLYWVSEHAGGNKHIVRFVESLDEYERAAVCYMGDLYHLAQFNDSVVREIIDALVKEPTVRVDNDFEWLNHVDEDTQAQIKVRFPEIVGKEHFWHDDVKARDDYWKVGSMACQIYQTLDKYADVINAFLMSKNVPFLISDFPSAIRRAGVGSDTDSAIFTVQDWAIWYNGNDDVTYDNILLSEAMAFIVSETTTHNLATMTVNIGVTDEKEVFRLSMKNEYLFPVFMLTSRSKHYAALQKVQEGVIFDKAKLEKKGVELIASNSPEGVRNDLDRLILDALHKQERGEKISLHEYLVTVAEWEHRIYDSISAGETIYLKAARVKEEDGYTKEAEKSRYVNYMLWDEVFADKFGQCVPPPYSALAFSIVPDTKTKTKKWIDSWDDTERAARLRAFMEKVGKVYLGEILLPEDNIMSYGIPKEILDVINVRKIVAKAVSPFYLFLESFEYYLQDKDQCKLIMDFISKEDIIQFKINKGLPID